jgi:hypothetical protein
MRRVWSRRQVMAAAAPVGVMGLVGAAAVTDAPAAGAQTPPGSVRGEPLIILRDPMRLLDTRINFLARPPGKLQPGQSLNVTVTSLDGGILVAAYLNLTITQTVGAGYLVVRGSDFSGERPLPLTSNINWSTTGQTLANLVLTTVGGENGVEVHAEGTGPTDVVVDLQAYVPFVG